MAVTVQDPKSGREQVSHGDVCTLTRPSAGGSAAGGNRTKRLEAANYQRESGQAVGLARGRTDAVRLLQGFAVTLAVFPSDTVIRALGAGAYVAGLVGMLIFFVWLTATLLGQHNPLEWRNPCRVGLVALWGSSLISYFLMHLHQVASVELLSADRWLMSMFAISGVILVASALADSGEVLRVLRAMVWGGAFVGLVAGLQFWASLDISKYLRMLPGFTINAATHPIDSRGGLNRVAGTAIHPIELGVVAGMLLPLAIYLALYDHAKRPWYRWTPVLLIAVAIISSVSRSAIVAVVLSLGVLIVLLPAKQRVAAFAFAPLGLAAVFMTAKGLIGTLTSFFLAGNRDPSIAHRTNNYSYVETLVRHSPWFGQGPGTYIPDGLHILDNQYLHTAIELGILGVVALASYMAIPLCAALVARRRSSDPAQRALCAALAGSAAAAVVCSATFDSFSFPMFVGVQSLVIGLIGACARTTRSRPLPADQLPQRNAPQVVGGSINQPQPHGGS